jgi:O-antigen ligase
LNPNKALFDGLEEFNFLFYSFIVSLFMLYILKKDEHKILIYAMTALIFYNCVLSYLSYIFDFGSVRGFFDNKVYYSRLLAIICTYLIILLFNTKEKSKKMILVTGILFLFINIAIQQQRGTYLIFLLAIAVILLATKNKKIILGGILSCCIIGLLFGYMIMKRVERDKMKIVNMSDAGRVSSTLAGVNMWKANPVFGVGHGTSRFKIREYENIRIFGFNNQMFAVHNVYVMQLAETGIVGFLLVNIARIMLLLALIRRFKGKKNIVKECPYELFYAISICIYLVSGMFQPINFREGYHLYLAVGAIILLRDSENNTNLEQQKLYLPQNKEF